MLLRHIFSISVTALTILAFSNSARADALDINLSNDVAQFQYIAPMGDVGQGKSEGHAGFLYNNKDNLLVDAGVLVSNEGDSPAFASIGIGIKGVAAKIEKNDSAALALGGQIRITPADDRKFAIVARVYFAPDIVTFGDAEKYIETVVRAEYNIMQNASAYVGYRKVTFDVVLPPPFPVTEVDLDEGIHVGVRIAF